MTCMFFSADVGKTIVRGLMTHPLQTVIKLSFVANGSESFCIHCFACWTSPKMILFSGSFHLLQDPGYRVWSRASHTKCSVSASTWYQWLHFLPVLGKHLLVKTGICRSSRGSECLNTDAYQSILQWYELCGWHGVIFQQSDDYSCLSHSYPADWTSRQSSADAAWKMSETCL